MPTVEEKNPGDQKSLSQYIFLNHPNSFLLLDLYSPSPCLLWLKQSISGGLWWSNVCDLPVCYIAQFQFQDGSAWYHSTVSQWTASVRPLISSFDISGSIQHDIRGDMLHENYTVSAFHEHIIAFQFLHYFQPSAGMLSSSGLRPTSSAYFLIKRIQESGDRIKHFGFWIVDFGIKNKDRQKY